MDDAHKHTAQWGLFKLMTFIIVLSSFQAWFTWSFNEYIVAALFVAVAIFNSETFSTNSGTIVSILLLFIANIFTAFGGNLNAYISILILITPCLLVNNLKQQYKEDLFYTFRHYFAIIIGISLAGWILFLIGIPLPSFESYHGTGEYKDSFNYFFENHIIFLVNRTNELLEAFPRFSSIFLEPGYFGCLLTLLLYLGKYQFDKENLHNWVFLLALIFTFSLAGWLISLVGLILTKLKTSPNKIRWIIIILFVYFLLGLLATNINGGNNALNILMFERLTFSDGTMQGYNRSNVDFQTWFFTDFIRSNKLWFGDSTNENIIYGTNTDYLSYIVLYGLFAFIAYMAYIFHPVRKAANEKYSVFTFSLLYLLIFLQTYHLAFSAMYVIVFILGNSILENTKQ